ncbi:hypothetical protein [Chachezhania sediminis]|uniref:hypothetical protein n=1 Tax=Chachezhania sediminis TaxID=2599291 RepID=UPI00131BDB89|nr:hypothetical protein [Chachezhania sediminis]
MIVELCGVFGEEPVLIDLETGEPVEQTHLSTGCDWCHSFGSAIDAPPRTGVDWQKIALDFSHRLELAPPPHLALRLVGDAQTRGPPIL